MLGWNLQPGGINCFAPTAKGVLAEIHLNADKWSGWSSLGGELAVGRASCVPLGTNRIACYARGNHGQLASRAWNGGQTWDPWRNLGGAFSADPDCVVLSGAHVACFGRGPDGQFVAYLPNEGAGAPAWVTYGGHVEGRPSCAAVGGSDVACAVRGEDEQLYFVRGGAFAGHASGKLVSTGDPATTDPACTLSGGDFTCFSRNSERRLQRRTFAANGDMSDSRSLKGAPESMGASCLSMQGGALACAVSDTGRRIQFAMGGELEGEAMDGDDALGVDESPVGNWYLSSLETSAFCRVRLASETHEGGRRLEIERDCADLPGVSRATQWRAQDDLLEFLAPQGSVVARFRLTGSGRWISPDPRSAYMLSRDRPEQASDESSGDAVPGLRFGEGDRRNVVGPWRLTSETGQSCRIRLTDWPAGTGDAVLLRGPCSREIRAVQFWGIDKNSVVLVAGDGQVVARFTRQSPEEWQGENAPGTVSYTLTR